MKAEDRVRGVLFDYKLSTDRSGLVEALVNAVRLGDEDRRVNENLDRVMVNHNKPKVTVRRARSGRDKRRYITFTNGNRYPVDVSWLVLVDGEPTDYVLVLARWGYVMGAPTEGDDTYPLTCWHLGRGPGDVARFVYEGVHERWQRENCWDKLFDIEKEE